MTTQYFSLRSNMKQILMSSFLILKSIYRFVFIISDSLKIASYFAGSFGCYLTKTSRSYLSNNNHISTSIRSFGSVVSMAPKKVCIVGSGNWGSAIARLVGVNTARCPERFVKDVNMWVFEEDVDGRKLTEIINTDHENVKYLPGRPLPHNIVAVPDISDAALSADILIFVLPHQFIKRACAPLKGKLKEGAVGLSLIKVNLELRFRLLICSVKDFEKFYSGFPNSARGWSGPDQPADP